MAAVEDLDPVDLSDELVFTGLGGCQEVGRSCHILQYKGKTIMVWSSLHYNLCRTNADMYSSMLACTQAEKACQPCLTSTISI